MHKDIWMSNRFCQTDSQTNRQTDKQTWPWLIKPVLCNALCNPNAKLRFQHVAEEEEAHISKANIRYEEKENGKTKCSIRKKTS